MNYTYNISYEDFVANDLLLNAVKFKLVQISENSDKISQRFKEFHYDIPWGDIKGFRSKLIHNYGSIDYHIVYTIITQDLIELRKLLIIIYK